MFIINIDGKTYRVPATEDSVKRLLLPDRRVFEILMWAGKNPVIQEDTSVPATELSLQEVAEQQQAVLVEDLSI